MSSEHDDIAFLVLRFRDLVTAPGETIQKHRELAESSGSVWWGWWAKSGETVPDAVFRKQNTRGPEGAKVCLFDSGPCQLWTAKLRQIKWDANHARIETPSKDLTPQYYNEQKFFAWFELSDFEKVEKPEDFLKQYSYVRVDAFFGDGKSRYQPFYGKQVFDTEELRQQDRSVWFLRRHRNGDPTHKVSLLSERRIEPAHFPREYELTKSWNLLWVSDLHFSETGEHGFPTENDSPNHRTLGNALEEALVAAGISDYGGILVSGDLTWRAKDAEFEDARAFIRRITRSPSALKSYRIALCPGNHDIAFSPDPAERGTPVNVAPEAARRAFADFYRSLFFIQPNASLSSGRRFLLGECFPVEVVCLNTSLLEQSPGAFQGQGFVGMEQLTDVEKGLRWGPQHTRNVPKPFRVLMMHHHLLPTNASQQPEHGRSYSMILDAGRVTDFIVRHRIDLVLHGHMHEMFFARELRQTQEGDWHHFYVAGLGSTGVRQQHRKQDNTYAVLSFNHSNPRLVFRAVSPEENNPRVIASYELDFLGARAAITNAIADAIEGGHSSD